MKIEKQIIPTPDKGEITLVSLTNGSGATVTLSSVGAGIVSVVVPDKEGKLEDVALGYADPRDYFYDGPCAGKCPGRYANRIARGHFSIDGKEYTLAINNGPNALHGGPEGFQNRVWACRVDGDKVEFTYVSADGEEGYPGQLAVKATYTWSDDNCLTLNLEAETDKATVVNLTNHAYWNLDGESSGTVLDHTLWLAASKFLPTDETLIPTGEMAPVAGTPMDFTTAKPIGRDMDLSYTPIKYGKGYDHCWMVDDWAPGKLKTVARLEAAKSGRILEVSTTQPAAQVYAGCWLSGSPKNKSGRSMEDYDGVAIECQHPANCPNEPAFPTTLLRPGEKYAETIQFKFTTK
ncbi:MAG: galactose mutarotase [Pseudoflavonifractor sp.]|nr:galactose mutarotase [Alloprevotella sp.]MCM1117052.1 galactose mutarotase [Pseudoflavonifractor sp.]